MPTSHLELWLKLTNFLEKRTRAVYKMTFASADPAGAQEFAIRYLGAEYTPQPHKGGNGECALVKWVTFPGTSNVTGRCVVRQPLLSTALNCDRTRTRTRRHQLTLPPLPYMFTRTHYCSHPSLSLIQRFTVYVALCQRVS